MKVLSLNGALASVFSFASSTSLIAGSAFFASILVGSTLANAATFTFDDGAFGSATQTIIFQDAVGTPATVTMPCANCGNPNGAGFLVATGTANTAVFIGEPNWIYNPATQGAVLSISGSIDRQLNFPGGGTASAVLRLGIAQGGNVYFTSVTNDPVLSGGYHTLSSGGPLTANDFGLYDTSSFNPTPLNSHPDLSQSFELGYLTLSQTGIITSAQFDNLHFDVNAAPLATPLPAALPLFATGLGALALLGWRRKRKNVSA